MGKSLKCELLQGDYGKIYYSRMIEGIKQHELRAFKNRLHVGDYITLREPSSDGSTLWYGIQQEQVAWQYNMYIVVAKYPHVCVLYKRVGKRNVRTAMDYTKMYIESGKAGERFEE